MATTIRLKIDSELTRRVGKWFTVREIQDKLRVNPATLKPLLMRYARENVLRRRSVKGTARSVQFSPATSNLATFKKMLNRVMPYRNFTTEFPMARGKGKSPSERKSRGLRAR